MKPIFTQSAETVALVQYFTALPIGQSVSFSEASRALGFRVTSTLPAYQTAKKVCERDHRVVIAAVRGHGFQRIDGSGMVARAPAFFKRVRKGARREARVQEIAISQNLARGEMIAATEQLSRLRILETTAVGVRPTTNRQEVEMPAPVVSDNRNNLRGIGRL